LEELESAKYAQPIVETPPDVKKKKKVISKE
jgi:hypothetical protein